jgi:hypothetical protein
MRQLLRRLWYALRQRQFETDLAEELKCHHDMSVRTLEAEDVHPSDAAVDARRPFGSAALARDQARDVWVWRWLQDLAQDVRFAFRTLRTNPTFSIITVGTLAIGIGAKTAIFGLLDSVVWRCI